MFNGKMVSSSFSFWTWPTVVDFHAVVQGQTNFFRIFAPSVLSLTVAAPFLVSWNGAMSIPLDTDASNRVKWASAELFLLV